MKLGFTAILTIVFIVLKLTGYISWSWWWVVSPIFFGLLAWFLFFSIVLLINWILE